MSAKPNRLIDQEKALESFFDSLLRDVEAYAQQESKAEQVVVESNAAVEVAIEPVPPVVNETRPVLKTVTTLKTAVIEEVRQPNIFAELPTVASPVVETEEIAPVEEISNVTAAASPLAELEIIEAAPVAPTPEPAPAPIGKPDWAEHEFQAMLFKVAGLTLAVPLVDLNGVIEWDDERVTEMPGHADFYLGLMNHLGKNVPLVDTARLVLPPDKIRVLAGDNPLARLTRIVLIHNSDYGLACDEVNEVITLKPDDVRWRTSRTQRRWLAGTVIEHMCALIDAAAFAQLLSSRASVDAFRE